MNEALVFSFYVLWWNIVLLCYYASFLCFLHNTTRLCMFGKRLHAHVDIAHLASRQYSVKRIFGRGALTSLNIVQSLCWVVVNNGFILKFVTTGSALLHGTLTPSCYDAGEHLTVTSKITACSLN